VLRAVLVLATMAIAVLRWPAPADGGPRYDAEGRLLLPPDLERWIAVGSSLGLGYSAAEAELGHEMFHTVLLDPHAYDAYRRSGSFPDGTMLALLIREPAPRVAPARSGKVAGDLVAIELAVKDSARFHGKWAYFDFGLPKGVTSASPLPRERCQACHAQHATKDNVFLQFYPLLRGRGRSVLP
jgi:hypothetical protein